MSRLMFAAYVIPDVFDTSTNNADIFFAFVFVLLVIYCRIPMSLLSVQTDSSRSW